MKISVLITEDAKQVMLEPENAHEKSALKLIAPHDKIEAVSKWGSFGDEEHTYGYEVGFNQAGYINRWKNNDCLMLVVTDKLSATPEEK